jgi:hypothetical protein
MPCLQAIPPISSHFCESFVQILLVVVSYCQLLSPSSHGWAQQAPRRRTSADSQPCLITLVCTTTTALRSRRI